MQDGEVERARGPGLVDSAAGLERRLRLCHSGRSPGLSGRIRLQPRVIARTWAFWPGPRWLWGQRGPAGAPSPEVATVDALDRPKPSRPCLARRDSAWWVFRNQHLGNFGYEHPQRLGDGACGRAL
jgi:hypothetical protein